MNEKYEALTRARSKFSTIKAILAKANQEWEEVSGVSERGYGRLEEG